MTGRNCVRALPRLVAGLLVGAIVLGVQPARGQGSPDFDTVAWGPLTCVVDPLTPMASPAELNLVGDATFPAVYSALDPGYLHVRYRVDGNPGGGAGFARGDWTLLVQVPSGDPFAFQYQLTLNGEGDTIEVWRNTNTTPIDFTPLFEDDTEVRLYSQSFAATGGAAGNTAPLGRVLPVTDGSRFRGTTDYFVDVAFPVGVLVAQGVVTSGSELATALIFPATANRPNTHNRDHLNCPFFTPTALGIDKTVTPTTLLGNRTTPLTYAIAVTNTGTVAARGVVVMDPTLPPFLANFVVGVTSSDPTVTATLVSTLPLEVHVPALPAGASVTVQLDAQATPGCQDATVPNVATAFATNAPEVSDGAEFQVTAAVEPESCDGVDNDCDGSIDEDPSALCSDNDPCNGIELCGGTTGCQPGTPLDCGDGEPCTVDGCAAPGGCTHTPIPGCTGCTDPAECSDGDGCTVDGCSAGTCTHTPTPGCRSCATPANCNDDNSCTDDICTALGTCDNPPRAGCIPCDGVADCNDGNPCTTDTCAPDGACSFPAIAGCQRCSTAAECDDANACTTDVCLGGACANAPIAGCGDCVPAPEVCDDDRDNDCDELSDCADPDCAGAPACAPRVEACDNCIDDDGDGLADYEDGDCCPESISSAIERVLLRPPPLRVRGDRLGLLVQYSPVAPTLFNPLRQDTSVQLSDAGGSLMCATITSDRWRRDRRLRYLFTDRKGTSGGLSSGIFSVNRHGNIMFKTRGKPPGLRPFAGSSVRVTVRVGVQCSMATATLRPDRKGYVFP